MKTLYTISMHFKSPDPAFWDSYLSPYLEYKIHRDLREIEANKPGSRDDKILFVQSPEEPQTDGSWVRRLDFQKFTSMESAVDFYNKLKDPATVWPNVPSYITTSGIPGHPPNEALVDISIIIDMILGWANNNNISYFAEVAPVEYDGIDPNTGLSMAAGRDFASGEIIEGENFYPSTAPEVGFPE